MPPSSRGRCWAACNVERARRQRTVQRRRDGHSTDAIDEVANEVPAALRYNGASFAVLMATPCDLANLALGFSLSEGIVSDAGALAIRGIAESVDGIVIDMRIADTHAEALAARARADTHAEARAAGARSLPGYGGCAVCGARELETVLRSPPPLAVGARVDEAAVHRALAERQARQPLNAATGATHAAGVARGDGALQLVREDVSAATTCWTSCSARSPPAACTPMKASPWSPAAPATSWR